MSTPITAMSTATNLPVPGQRWTLAPEFLLRVAGLPVQVIDSLRCAASLHWSEEVLAAEDRLRAAAERLSDHLAGAIGHVEDKSVRSRLVRLRRDIFNLRLPEDADVFTALAVPLAPTVTIALATWVAGRRRLEALRALGPELLASEGEKARGQLRRLLNDPRVRSGLLLASPALEAQLDAYVGDPGSVPDKRARKIERSAVNYVYRAASKPSPFSTFTGVALGRFAEPEEAKTEQAVDDRWTSSVRVSVVALSRLFDAVLTDPDRRGDLTVVLASGWGRDNDRVRYVRRSLRTGDAAATVTFDAARDQLFFLRRSDILEGMLALLSAGSAPLYRDVAAWLGEQLGAAATECEHYLATLLELGMLQMPLLTTRVHSADPLRSFRSALADVDRPWARDLASALDAPMRCLDEYPAAAPTLRRTLLRELRGGLGAALESLGASAELLPSTLVYEDVRAAAEPVACDADDWDGLVGEALRSLDGILPAFDLNLRHKQTLLGFFLARCGSGGRCEDLLRLVHDFHEDIYDEYLSWEARHPRIDESGRLAGDPNWLGLPSVTALDEARATFAELLGRLAAADPDADEIELGPDVLAAVAGALGEPGIDAGFAARTHFLQRADRADLPLVVHNSAFGGFSFPFSRFTHCFDEPPGDAEGQDEGLVNRLRLRARRMAPPGAVLAEVTGGSATTNLNLHGRLTDYEIVCPGEVSSAPASRRIDLTDLVLEHDPVSDRLVLRSQRLGCEVVPIYLGYLLPQALPAISRTLLLLSPSATLWLDPWAGIPHEPRAIDGVLRRPRLRIGPLVLSRRSWTVVAADLPLAGVSATPDEQFLAWQRWRRRHGVPTRAFATVQPSGDQPRGPRRAKPSLVDFGSTLSLAAFQAMLNDPGSRIVITEMLPEPERLHVRSRAGFHVAELAVETVSHRSAASTREAAAVPTTRSA